MAAENISKASQRRLLIHYPFTLAIMFFLYGFYALLFGMALYLLRQCQSRTKQTKLYLVSIIALFATTTVMVIGTSLLKYYSVAVDFELVDEDTTLDLINTCYGLYNLLPPLANIIADVVLIHRCYIIWSCRKQVAFPLIVLSVATNVIYLVGAAMVFVFGFDSTLSVHSSFDMNGQIVVGVAQLLSALVNMTLTLLTAGRIWWVHRQARRCGIQANDNTLQFVVRIMPVHSFHLFIPGLINSHVSRLESGILYPIAIIIGLVIETILMVVVVDLLPVVTLFAGIAPTLVIVRARFEKLTRDTRIIVSDIRFDIQTETESATASLQIQTLQLADGDPEQTASST